MLSRGGLFGLGLLALIGGLSLAFLYYRQSLGSRRATRRDTDRNQDGPGRGARPAGRHAAALGDMAWDEVPAGTVVGADIVRGSASETDFVGAATRRAFAARQPLTAAELAKPGDREFLVAVLAPGYRAVSINVDAVQSASGLVLPDDHVDVILTQSFGAAEHRRRAPDGGRDRAARPPRYRC